MDKYVIIRFYTHHPAKVLRRGVSLEDAKAHCEHPDSNSATATSRTALRLTARYGAWFDGYNREPY